MLDPPLPPHSHWSVICAFSCCCALPAASNHCHPPPAATPATAPRCWPFQSRTMLRGHCVRRRERLDRLRAQQQQQHMRRHRAMRGDRATYNTDRTGGDGFVRGRGRGQQQGPAASLRRVERTSTSGSRATTRSPKSPKNLPVHSNGKLRTALGACRCAEVARIAGSRRCVWSRTDNRYSEPHRRAVVGCRHRGAGTKDNQLESDWQMMDQVQQLLV